MSDYEEPEITVLAVEDDEEMLDLLDQVLTEEGYRVIKARDGREALGLVATADFDIILTDVRMPELGGMELLMAVREKRPDAPVIIMTAFGSIESAVRAMKEGAYSYITKPFDIDELVSLLEEVAAHVKARKLADMISKSPDPGERFAVIFRSQVMREVLALVQNVAQSQATVLITGESGTGKELIAREIHRRSGRREGPFVAVDTNAVPESLIESELFGHVRGAFTGALRDKRGMIEIAEGGTLFLDQIGSMNPAIQTKLLRFLQERTLRRIGDVEERRVNVRLVAATRHEPSALLAAGFRHDLYYRLAVFHVSLPPLRERREDIPSLVEHFLRKHGADLKVEGFGQEALDALVGFGWPGNVRQLENAVEHAIILRKTGIVQKSDLPRWLQLQPVSLEGTTPSLSLESMEKSYILRLLKECGGNRSQAARLLGINRRTLARKLKSYGISADEALEQRPASGGSKSGPERK